VQEKEGSVLLQFLSASRAVPSTHLSCISTSHVTFLADSCVASFEFFQFLIRELFNVNHVIARGYMGTNQFIQLEVKGFSIAILRELATFTS
jgi:hypothetical protein